MQINKKGIGDGEDGVESAGIDEVWMKWMEMVMVEMNVSNVCL